MESECRCKKALLISCFDWYKARLEPIRNILIRKGYKVYVIESDFDHINKCSLKNQYKECKYIHVPVYKKNVSLNRIWSHLIFGYKVRRIINKLNPDLIYLLLPPNNTGLYCNEYKRRHPQIKYIIDIIDLWPESMPLGKLRNTLPARAWGKWRDNSIKEADYIFTECGLYQNKLSKWSKNKKSNTLHLFKKQTDIDKEVVRKIIENKSKDDSIIKFAYLGSMNNIIDIDGICKVIKEFQISGYKCELHAIGEGESRSAFESAVKEVGCTTYFYGRIFDEKEKISILTPCDFAFNMMKDDVSVGLTIKSIDYLSYGLPLINNIKGDTKKIVQDKKIGLTIDKYNKNIDIERLLQIDRITVLEIFDKLFSEKVFVEKVAYAMKMVGI